MKQCFFFFFLFQVTPSGSVCSEQKWVRDHKNMLGMEAGVKLRSLVASGESGFYLEGEGRGVSKGCGWSGSEGSRTTQT